MLAAGLRWAPVTICVALVATSSAKGDPMGKTELRYGFRHDLMAWVERDTGLVAARVRAHVLGRPTPEDTEAIRLWLADELAAQLPNGSFADDVNETAAMIHRLMDYGWAADAPQAHAAGEWLVENVDMQAHGAGLALSVAAALSRTGLGESATVRQILQRYRQASPQELLVGPASVCPWSLTDQFRRLWHCRDAGDMDAPILTMATAFRDGLTEAGTMCFVDTWGLLPVASDPTCPFGREMIERMLPMFLRAQYPDGAWGERTFDVMRALVTHGLLTRLLELPPLPRDWQVVRSVDLPDGDLHGLTWGDGRLWVCDRAAGQALAIHPDDGSVTKAVKLPPGPGVELGWWEGLLAYTQGVPEPAPRDPNSQKLFLIDPDTGETRHEFALDWIPRITSATQMHDAQYGDKLWLCDPGEGITYYLDPRTGAHDYGPDVADANIKRVFPADQGVWHAGWNNAMLVKSDENGWRLLDYGDMPFEGPKDYFSHPGPGYCDGLAWDGERLWALDARENRLCVIQKSDSGKMVSESLAARR